jgi:hypothetical protein
VEEVARLVVAAVAGGVRVEHDDVVELEALTWRTSVTSTPGRNANSCARHAAQRGHLGAAQPVEVTVGLLGVAGQQRDGGARLARGQLAQRLGQERDGGADAREAERLDRRAGAWRLGRVGVGERAHRRARDRQDLARRTVGDAQRLDGDVAQIQVRQHAAPVAETVVQEQPLRRVAGERDRRNAGAAAAAARRVADQHRQLHRRQVLRLVDEQVRERMLRAAQQLAGAQQDRDVVGVERRQVVVGRQAVDAGRAAHVLIVVRRRRRPPRGATPSGRSLSTVRCPAFARAPSRSSACRATRLGRRRALARFALAPRAFLAGGASPPSRGSRASTPRPDRS